MSVAAAALAVLAGQGWHALEPVTDLYCAQQRRRDTAIA
jgi:hypothetical protein